MLEKGNDDVELNERGKENLEKLLDKAKYSKTDRDQILSEYTLFKAAVKKLYTSDKKGSGYIRMFEHILYKVRECKKKKCVDDGRCQEKNRLLTPKQPIPMRFLHLFLKEKELYDGVQNFLHLLLRCIVITHAEGVAESMGSLIDIHSDKRRNLCIEDVGKDALVHRNRPPLHLSDALRVNARDRHFITKNSKFHSTVVKRLSHQVDELPFI